MGAISFVLPKIHDQIIQSYNEMTESQVIEIKINEEQINVEKNEAIHKILNRLHLQESSWINPADNLKDSDLYKLLDSLIEKSLVEILLKEDIVKHGLRVDYKTSFHFEDNDLSGVKMNYAVTHSDNSCNLFKLQCTFSFDKDGLLNNEKSTVSIEFYPQCSEDLKQLLDPRNIITKILDWLKSLLFNTNYPHDNNSILVEYLGLGTHTHQVNRGIEQDDEVDNSMETLSTHPKDNHEKWDAPFENLKKHEFESEFENVKIEEFIYRDKKDFYWDDEGINPDTIEFMDMTNNFVNMLEKNEERDKNDILKMEKNRISFEEEYEMLIPPDKDDPQLEWDDEFIIE
jgi:hypothetical protein